MTTLADIAAAASEFNAKADALQARMDAAAREDAWAPPAVSNGYVGGSASAEIKAWAEFERELAKAWAAGKAEGMAFNKKFLSIFENAAFKREE